MLIFESDDFVLRGRPDLTEYVKPGAGFALRVLRPERPAGMYHAESVEEDFLVLMGECILIIEDQERHLRAWDFVHCPPGAAHTFIGAGSGPCVLLCAGNRDLNDETCWRVYKRSDVAMRCGASVESDTSSGAEANAPFLDRLAPRAARKLERAPLELRLVTADRQATSTPWLGLVVPQ